MSAGVIQGGLLMCLLFGFTVSQDPWEDPFLPHASLKPVHYDLRMNPDFYYDGTTYQGRITMEIEILQDTRYLIVHQKMMEVTSTSVKDSAFQDIAVSRAFAYDANQYWVVETVNSIASGATVFLTLDFTGDLDNGIVGYYKSTYINADTGMESWLATTKFQPTEARKAFPHFDEPRFKTSFNITLRHWNNFTAISNMPDERIDVIDGTWSETVFQKSVPMSSYLVCFIVFDFAYKENSFGGAGTRFKETPHRVWATPDKIDQVDYALATGAMLMDWYQNEMDIEYHLPKMDQVAVPDYPSGATEHWGIVTYRERSLLFDPTQAGTSDKNSLTSTLSHELSHMYFGNPVTCLWWDEIWLNEGFATYWSRPAIDAVYSEFEMMNQMVPGTFQAVMISDSRTSSRPMLVPITSPEEANSAFDTISYSKGASILRVMRGFLGYDVFLKGTQTFLKDYDLQSVTTPDFISSMQKEIDAAGLGLDLSTIMDTWFEQMGFPVINVDINGGNLEIRQTRFLSDPTADPDQPPSPFNYKWEVWMDYQTRDGNSGDLWLNKGDRTISNPAASGEWIKFNSNETGFYRVNYDPTLWDLLATQLKTDLRALNELDRSNLLDDAFNLARAEQLDYGFALDLSSYLQDEDHYVPWNTARRAVEYIGDMLYGTKHYTLWRKFIQDITDKSMERLGVSAAGTHLDQLNRLDVMRLACTNGHVGCLRNSTRLFQDWIIDDVNSAVPTDIRSMVYQFGLGQTDGDKNWFTLWDRYMAATSPQEKLNLMNALSKTNRIWLINKLLDYAMDDTKIREQDFFACISNIASNPNANPIAWRWARKNYDTLVERFGVQDRYFGGMVPDMVSGYSTENKLKEVTDFYAKYPDAGPGASNRAASIASIETNISWMQRNEKVITDWLQQNIQI